MGIVLGYTVAGAGTGAAIGSTLFVEADAVVGAVLGAQTGAAIGVVRTAADITTDGMEKAGTNSVTAAGTRVE